MTSLGFPELVDLPEFEVGPDEFPDAFDAEPEVLPEVLEVEFAAEPDGVTVVPLGAEEGEPPTAEIAAESLFVSPDFAVGARL